MARVGLQDAPVDFRGAQPMISRSLGHTEMEADWTAVLDGMFFNRVMKRSTAADPPGQ